MTTAPGGSAIRTPGIGQTWDTRAVLLALCFFLFLLPLDIGGISVNYGFALVPVAMVLVCGRFHRPSDAVLFCIAFFSLDLVLAVAYQYELLNALPRRLASFLTFMSVFSLCFVRISPRMVDAFRFGVILSSVSLSAWSIWTFFTAGGLALGFEAKVIVGSQRYGFIYLLGLWLLFYAPAKSLAGRLLKLTASGIVFLGIGLTFSRASIVALAVSLIIFSFWPGKGLLVASHWRRVGAVLCVVALLGGLAASGFPLLVEFFSARLLPLLQATALTTRMLDPQTSEGTRFFILNSVLDFVLRNPLTGSGFLGIWAFAWVGSAHNQYLDALLRVGIIGFLLYGLLLGKIAWTLKARDNGLFWGFLSILVYGFFHETFKESQGGFVLAFLLAWCTQNPPEQGSDPTQVHERRPEG